MFSVIRLTNKNCQSLLENHRRSCLDEISLEGLTEFNPEAVKAILASCGTRIKLADSKHFDNQKV